MNFFRRRGLCTLAVLLFGAARPAASQTADVERWSLEPELRIGSVDAPDYTLTYVSNITVGADGSIYVAQPFDGLARVFHRNGQFSHTIGRSGQGPGEFLSVGRLTWFGDTLVVSDSRQGRLTLLDPSGKVLETHQIPVPAAPGYSPGAATAMLRNGSALGEPSSRSSQTDRQRENFPVYRVNQAGEPLDTIGWSRPARGRLTLRNDEGLLHAVIFFRPLIESFSESLLWLPDPHGAGILLVERPTADNPDSARFRVTRLTAEGDTVFSRQYRYTPRAVPDSVNDRMAREIAKLSRLPNRIEALRAARRALDLPPFFSPIRYVVAGADGTVWLRREERPGPSDIWNVLDERGNVQAVVTVPKGTDLHYADKENVWGVVTDDLDIPYVVRYRIDRAPS